MMQDSSLVILLGWGIRAALESCWEFTFSRGGRVPMSPSMKEELEVQRGQQGHKAA